MDVIPWRGSLLPFKGFFRVVACVDQFPISCFYDDTGGLKDGALDATTDWIGNSFSGRNVSEYNSLFHVPLDMDGIYVTPDGTIYTNTTYEEGGRPAMAFNKYGRMISPMNANSSAGPQTYFGPYGGVAVATSGHYNFLSHAPGGTGIGIRDTNTWLITSYTVSGRKLE